jgi:hypothetical protein
MRVVRWAPVVASSYAVAPSCVAPRAGQTVEPDLVLEAAAG